MREREKERGKERARGERGRCIVKNIRVERDVCVFFERRLLRKYEFPIY